MRCFIGIDLPKKLKNEIEKFVKELDKSNVFYGKSVEKNNLHLSLKFLGELDEKQVEKVRKNLDKINFNAFNCYVKDIGSFPNKNYVKVLWLGIDKGRKDVVSLHEKIENSIENISKKSYRFEPHITLIRVKNISNKTDVQKFFKNNETVSFGRFDVNSFYLFKSTLTPEGPIYEKIKEFKLNE